MSIEHLKKANEMRKASGVPVKATNPEDRFAAKNTRKTAIDAFCVHCMGGVENDGYRSLIRECTAKPDSVQPCSLYAWRPYK